MSTDTNTYESPAVVSDTNTATENRRPFFGTLLIGVWILEGGFKLFLLSPLFLGFNPIPFIVDDYRQSGPYLFFLVSSFLIIETIGPWIGICYLTGRRSRTLPFHAALLQTLKVAGGLAIVATLALMLSCHFAGT